MHTYCFTGNSTQVKVPESIAEPLWRQNDNVAHLRFIEVDQVPQVVVEGQKCYDFFLTVNAHDLAMLSYFWQTQLRFPVFQLQSDSNLF